MTEEEDDLDREMAGKKVRRELVMVMVVAIVAHQVAEELPPEQLLEFREIFNFFDRFGC